jgi:hypothetical protein
MNLRVDLILDTEKRSGSAVSLKSAIRIAIIFVPICIVVFVLVTLLDTTRLTKKACVLEGSWADAQIKQSEAAVLAATFTRNRNILAELEGWRAAHAEWNEHLIAILKIIPDSIQLNNLNVKHKIAVIGPKNRYQGREFILSLTGKAYGPTASADVDTLKRKLGIVEPLCDQLKEIRVPIFRQDDDADAAKSDRIFMIECHYKPKLFKESN